MIKFAGPLAHGVLDLVPAILRSGGYRIPPRAKGAPPWGDLRRKRVRQSPLEVPQKSPRSPLEVGSSRRNTSENRDRILNGFWIPKLSQKPPKMDPKPSKNHSKTYRVFDRISDAIFNDFLLLFAAAQPSISLLFTTRSWGSAFFVESGKYQKQK